MRWLAGLSIAVALAACGGAPAPKRAKRVAKTTEPAPPPAPAEHQWVEDCNAKFNEDPEPYKKQGISWRLSNQRWAKPFVEDGDAALDAATGKDITQTDQIDAIVGAIDHYRAALKKDPYSAAATLGLARAYYASWRKGCALAMLKRLAALQTDPTYARDAKRALDDIENNPQWFREFRKEALMSVGY